MPLRRKLLLYMVVPAALLAVVGAVGLYSLDQLERAAGRVLADNYRTIQAAREMERALRRLELTVLGHALLGPGVEGGAKTALVRELVRGLERCEANITEPAEPEILARIRADSTALVDSLGGARADGRLDAEAMRATGERLFEAIDALIAVNEAAMFSYERRSRSVAHAMLAALSLSLAGALVALLLFATTAANRISRPILQVASRLHQALRGGDGDAPTEGHGGDEIGQLRIELDALLARLGRYEDEQNRKLQQQFEDSRRRFIAMLSHQLKTPMTSLSMSVHLLRERLSALTEHDRELLTIATEEAAALGRLITELVDAAREPAADVAVRPRPVELVSLLLSTLRPLAPQAEERGIELATPPRGQVLHVAADPVKFPWVITNIVGNALRYTPAGGRIAVAVEAQDAHVEVVVSDTGVGIAAADLERIFLPNVSLEPHSHGSTHGLGLAIAKEIVDAHQGSIHAESELGRGTRFRIRLPRT